MSYLLASFRKHHTLRLVCDKPEDYAKQLPEGRWYITPYRNGYLGRIYIIMIYSNGSYNFAEVTNDKKIREKLEEL